MKIREVITISTILVFLVACGGGSSSNNKLDSDKPDPVQPTPDIPTNKFKSISGFVIDAPIVGAYVKMTCSDKSFQAKSLTDIKGSFLIEKIPNDLDLSNCMFNSTGGKDSKDGDDLSGITLKSLYSLFNRDKDIYITPLTNLVASQNNVLNDLDSAKKKSLAFLGDNIRENQLIINPLNNIDLSKKAKQLTKIAITSRINGSKVEFIDLDNTNEKDIMSYALSLENISIKDKETLLNTLKAIEKSTSVEQVMEQSLIDSTYNLLKEAYKQTNYSEQQNKNLKTLAFTIVEANIRNDNYEVIINPVTKSEIRKALTNAKLLPEFEKDSNDLVPSLNDTLSLSDNDFKSYLKDNPINLSKTNALILYDSSKDYKVLGDDIEKRRNYYTFSDKSNVAKALRLIKNSYSDAVNDPVNAQVAIGLAKLGSYQKALDYIEKNIYSSTKKRNAYRDLGKTFISLNQPSFASSALFNQFLILKKEIESTGKSKFSYSQNTTIQTIALDLGRINDKTKAKEVLDYLNSLSPYLTDTNSYSRLVQAYRNLSENIFLYNKNKQEAKKYAKKAWDSIDKMPGDRPSSALGYVFKTATNALFLGIDLSIEEIDKKGDIFDKENNQRKIGGYYEYYPFIIEALKGNIDYVVNNISKLKKRRSKQNLLTKGATTGFVIHNKVDKLFEFYNDSNIFSKKYYISNEIALDSYTQIPTVLQIKSMGTTQQLKNYLSKMRILINSWSLNSNSEIQKIYSQWDLIKDYNKKGYLAIAYLYKELGEDTLVKEIIQESLNKIDSINDMSIKIDSLQNISYAIEEIKIEDTTIKNKILEKLFNSALESNIKNIPSIITVANILSTNKQKKNAKILVEKAYSLIPTLISSDLKNIKKRKDLLIGQNYRGKYNFHSSIANGYLQLGEYKKAKEIIKEALNNINTLEETVDQYELLIDVVAAYASINDYDSVSSIINRIKTTKEHESALRIAAMSFASYNAFTQSKVANIDSDKDGKPDFWNIGVTQKEIDDSGLVLDDDIDGDGISDFEDTLPYDNIK